MASNNYDAIIARILKSEGGYANHPADPGGPTNYGITLATYQRFKNPKATAADVKVMPLGDAMDIYKQSYWNACGCGALPSGIDYAVMDYAVNSGNGRATTVLRHVVGLSTTASLKEVLTEIAKRSVKDIVNAICDERLLFMKSLKIWATFGAGWSTRVASVRLYSLALVNASADHPAAKAVPEPTSGSVGKAQHTVSKKAAATAGAAIPGAAAAGGAAIVPHSFVHDHIGLVILAVIIVVILVALVLGLLVGRSDQKQLTPMPVAPVPPLPPQGDLLTTKG